METLIRKASRFCADLVILGLTAIVVTLAAALPALGQAPSPTASPVLQAAVNGPAIQAVFLLDRSGSMPDPKLTGHVDPRFATEVKKVRESARWVLDSLKAYPEARVSFWYFGERGNLKPYAEDLTAAEALARVDGFFSDDPKAYRDQRTYIAHSMFELVRRVMKLGTGFTPKDSIPAEGDTFYLFVYTDGSEDNDPGFDNGPFAEWVKRHSRTLQIQWRKWQLYANSQERPPLGWPVPPPPPPPTPTPVPPAPDTIAYDVLFGEPALAAHLNLQQDSPERPIKLLVPRVVRLVPRVLGTDLPKEEQEELGLVVSRPDKLMGGPASSPAQDLKIQATVDWRGVAGTSTTPEWTLRAPARQVVPGAPGNPPVPNQIERRGILLELSDTQAILPSIKIDVFKQYEKTSDPDQSADGIARFPVRLVHEQLARELHRAYPNSTFVFQGNDGTQPRRLADIEVSDVPEYLFTVSTQEGVALDSPLAPLQADIWHRYTSSFRTFHITGPAGVQARYDYVVRVRFNGQDLTRADDVVALKSPTSTGLATSARNKEDVELSVPAQVQDALPSLLGRGFRRQAGQYTLEVTITPVVEKAPDPRYRVAIRRADSKTMAGPTDRLVVSIPVQVDALPIGLFGWLSIAGATVVVLWVTVRWRTRAGFPKVVIGKPRNYVDLQSAYAATLEGTMALFWRRPCYLNLESAGYTVFDHRTSADAGRNRQRQPNNTLGLLPGPGGFYLWCAAARRSADENFEIRVESRPHPLEVLGSRPRQRQSYHNSSQVTWLTTAQIRRGLSIQTWKRTRDPDTEEWNPLIQVEDYPVHLA